MTDTTVVMTRTEHVKQIIADLLDVQDDEVVPEATLEDLGADSLDVCNLALALEEAFDISVPEWDEDTFVTVGDVIEYVEAR